MWEGCLTFSPTNEKQVSKELICKNLIEKLYCQIEQPLQVTDACKYILLFEI